MVRRWGIVTAARISHDFVNAVNSLPGNTIDIAGIAARDVSRAKEFASKHNIRNVFTSYEDMAKSDQIDVAYIGSLNPEHYTLAKLFLENGKHVLCEKPLCLNYKQAKSLIDFAKNKNLFLMEAVWTRFLPIYYALDDEIKSEKIGDLVQVHVNFGSLISADRVTKKELGGSATLDIGIYALQFAQFIFKDEPTKVTTSGALNKNGVDESATIILDYAGGRRAVLNIHTKTRMDNYAEVYGTKGYVRVLDRFHCSERLRKADGSLLEIPLHTSPIQYNFHNSAGLSFQAQEVENCLDKGLLESPRMSHADSLTLAKLEDTVRQQLGVYYDADDQIY